MKLRMTTNLGLLDARRLGLPEALEGQTVDADQAAAESLLKCGWAVAVAAPAPPAADLKSPPAKAGNGNRPGA